MVEINEIVSAIERRDIGLLSGLTAEEANKPDEMGRTPLMHAVLANLDDASIVSLLLERGANVNNAEGKQKWTPLHVAARDQKLSMVRALLNAGAKIDAVDVFGDTPLWRSLLTDSPDFVVTKELLRHGADPRRKNNFGVAPIDIARDSVRPEKIALFADYVELP